MSGTAGGLSAVRTGTVDQRRMFAVYWRQNLGGIPELSFRPDAGTFSGRGRLPEGFVEYGQFAMLGEFEFFTGPGISPMSNYHYKYRVKDGVSVHMSIRHLALELEEGEIVDDVDVYREKICPYAYDPKISHPSAAKLGNLAYQPKYEVISLNNVHYQYTSEGYLRYMTTIVEGLLVSFTTNSEITFNDYAPEEENFLVRMIRGEDVSEELRTILAGE